MVSLKLIILLVSVVHIALSSNPCNSRTAKYGFICVCDSTYCDTVPAIQELQSGQYQQYVSSKSSPGFASVVKSLSDEGSSETGYIIVNLNKTYQTILGFGGALTDSTGINILSLPEAAQEHLLESYYGKNGLEYTIGRVPISGTDYSVRTYTYCDEEDETLEKFSLQEEDFKYKIPIIKRAEAIRGQSLVLFASSWSAPKWMKTNNDFVGKGSLKDEYYDLWATYYLKFFESYMRENVSFWGVTTQNEPYYGLTGETFNSMGFTAEQMNKWVSHLGPRIRASNFSNIKIILHDDFRSNLDGLIQDTLSNSEVAKYADGIGLHWYTDFSSPESILVDADAAAKKNDMFLLATEACILRPDEAGNWANAEQYVESIITDLSHNFIGWVDWNMVLNLDSGPSWVHNQYDSPVIVNASAGEFYKNPTFYAMGHFSKFIVPGSVRIETESNLDANIKQIAFLRPDGLVAVVVLNSGDSQVSVNLGILEASETISLEEHSLTTLLYKP